MGRKRMLMSTNVMLRMRMFLLLMMMLVDFERHLEGDSELYISRVWSIGLRRGGVCRGIGRRG